MLQDINLLIALAEIAGVFVGFGALISVTRRNEIAASQLGQIRAVVTIGLVVVVAALIPIGLGRYGIDGRDLWVICTILFLALIWASIIFSLRRPENRELMVTRARSNPATAIFFWILLEIPLQIPLILVLLAANPELDPAFYITSLVLNLFEAAFVLVQLVYSQAGTENA